jgi:U6 snRNA-associated Sm-like protein LSm6
MDTKRSPGDFLKRLVGNAVVVRLHAGTEYHGRLVCLDGFMNIALSGTEEHAVDGAVRSYGDAFIRGNNVLYIRAV